MPKAAAGGLFSLPFGIWPALFTGHPPPFADARDLPGPGDRIVYTVSSLRQPAAGNSPFFEMTDLSKDLAALRIPQEDRGGRRGRPVALLVTFLVVVALGAGAWYWATAMQAATVKVAPATVKAGAGSA